MRSVEFTKNGEFIIVEVEELEFFGRGWDGDEEFFGADLVVGVGAFGGYEDGVVCADDFGGLGVEEDAVAEFGGDGVVEGLVVL